jgi:predicted chitinase
MDLSFPIITDPTALPDQKAEALFALNEAGDAGFYPLGANQFWHGGIHFVTNEPLVAIGDGELVAYRMNKTAKECEITAMGALAHHTAHGFDLVDPRELAVLREESLLSLSGPQRSTHYSSGFVLVRHTYRTPRGTEIVFHALYMHLLPLACYAVGRHAPSIFHASRHVVIEKADGAGLPIYHEDDPNTRVGVIPFDMNFTMDPLRTPTPEWSRKRAGTAYRYVTFDGIHGFAAAARAAPVSGGHYRQTLSRSDKLLDAGAMGLNVRESGDAHSPVIRVLRHGTRVHFAMEPPHKGAYCELADGGFIHYTDKTIHTDQIVEPEAYDSVVVPKKRVKLSKGDILGYAGPYLTAPNICHFEIFVDNLRFRENPNHDDWGPRTFKILDGCVLMRRDPIADTLITVNFKKGDRVKRLEADPLSDFKKISGRALTGETAHGWIARALAGTDLGSHRRRLTHAVASLATEDGSPVAINAEPGDILTVDASKKRNGFFWVGCPLREIREGWTDQQLQRRKNGGFTLTADLATLHQHNVRTAYVFEHAAGQTGKDIWIRERGLPAADEYIHSDGSTHIRASFTSQEGDLFGWVRVDNPNVKSFSDYDWPTWRAFEDPSRYSSDGLCDVQALLDLLHGDSDLPPELGQIKTALHAPATATVLRNAFTAHPTEWDSQLDDVIGKWDRLAGPPWDMPQKLLDDTQKHIDQLQFWSEATAKGAHLPEPSKVWHAHPIGFLLHLKNLMGVTAAQIKAMYAPNVDDADIDRYVVPLNNAMRRAEVNTRLRQAHFFAQLGEESDRLAKALEDDDGSKYENGYEELLANVEQGDGPRFRGHGLIQITGRANITFYVHDRIGTFFTLPPGPGTDAQRLKQLVEDEATLRRITDEPEIAADSAGWYWSECTRMSVELEDVDSIYSFVIDRPKPSAPGYPAGTHYTLVQRRLVHCNASADQGATLDAVDSVLSRIGGDPKSLPRRQAYFRASKRVLLE